jgi:hypothetical protein
MLPLLLLGLISSDVHAQPAGSKSLPKFMGRVVTLATPELDESGFFAKGPASVCVEGPPLRECFTVPSDYGRHPQVEVIQID